jgi:nitrogenase molybdenum-iron protein alpha/beta subunit
MNYIEKGFPVPSDYFGVLWALAGIRDGKVVEHGSTGTMAYNAMNFDTLNRLNPKGSFFSSGMNEEDVILGKEDKLIAAIKEVDQLYSPKLLSIVATGITSVIGLDLAGNCQRNRAGNTSKNDDLPGWRF